MSDKKHIDRLFQEKLKDFEATPSDAVWDNINSQLKKEKDDRKVIPIWWKFAGVAAALLLLLTVGNLIFNNSETTTIVETEKVDSNNKKVDEKNNTLVDSENKSLKESIDESSDESLLNEDEVIQSEISNKNNGVANSNEPITKKNLIKLKTNQSKYQEKKANNSTNYLVNTQPNDVPNSNKLSEQPSNIIEKTIETPSLNQETKKEVLAENKTDKPNVIEENLPEDIINNNKEELLVIEEEKDKIALTEELVVSNDDDDDTEEKEAINRWQINPNIAPVYFNSFGEGSPIHEQLIDNKKSGDVNMSYGINVSYALNDKLSIKSGVNRVNLGYSTNDVIVYENVGTSLASTNNMFKNIKLKNSVQSLSFVSGNSFTASQNPAIVPEKSIASLNQEMTYYEIPLELKYKVLENKLGFSIVGGFSTFILNDNKVSYELRGESNELGEAANLNDVSYSANFGLGLNYNISKNVNLNLDPMFKYQINTFNNTSGDFKPYFIGVYSGISLKF